MFKLFVIPPHKYAIEIKCFIEIPFFKYKLCFYSYFDNFNSCNRKAIRTHTPIKDQVLKYYGTLYNPLNLMLLNA